jgi:hypothetical protein
MFRVPQSTIELRVACTRPVDVGNLGNTLLRIHDYIKHHIDLEGDKTLWPKNDPFGWYVLGPDPRVGLNFTAKSIVPRNMTWSVLQLAAEGLYLSLPREGRNWGARFQIWDFERDIEWGYGQVGVFTAPGLGQNVLALPEGQDTIVGGSVVGNTDVSTS